MGSNAFPGFCATGSPRQNPETTMNAATEKWPYCRNGVAENHAPSVAVVGCWTAVCQMWKTKT